jgi:glutamyl/glutaminyl-tRNA synthetase
MHLPLILTNGKKMSEKDPSTHISHLRSKGYLPEAIVNFAALLSFDPNLSPPSEGNQ